MNLTKSTTNDIWVTLSRRSLETLLKMLDQQTGLNTLHRQTGQGLLHVAAEENEEHYSSSAREASVRGQMGIGPEDVEVSERLENKMDLKAVRAALKEPGRTPLRAVMKELGLCPPS